MAFKVINDFKECIINIINSNSKTKIKKEGGVCSLSFTPSLKFEGLPSNDKVDSFYEFFASFFLDF